MCPSAKQLTSQRQDKSGSLLCAAEPRHTSRRTGNSHDHIEVVAAFKWRIDQRHAARAAHAVPFGPTGHHCIADFTPFETPPVILIARVSNHANNISERLCNALSSCAAHKDVPF